MQKFTNYSKASQSDLNLVISNSEESHPPLTQSMSECSAWLLCDFWWHFEILRYDWVNDFSFALSQHKQIISLSAPDPFLLLWVWCGHETTKGYIRWPPQNIRFFTMSKTVEWSPPAISYYALGVFVATSLFSSASAVSGLLHSVLCVCVYVCVYLLTVMALLCTQILRVYWPSKPTSGSGKKSPLASASINVYA